MTGIQILMTFGIPAMFLAASLIIVVGADWQDRHFWREQKQPRRRG